MLDPQGTVVSQSGTDQTRCLFVSRTSYMEKQISTNTRRGPSSVNTHHHSFSLSCPVEPPTGPHTFYSLSPLSSLYLLYFVLVLHFLSGAHSCPGLDRSADPFTVYHHTSYSVMSQTSKPAAASYFKAVAKILLQKTSSRSKGTKAKESSAISMSTSRTSTDLSFQHCNGRRLSYTQYHRYRSEHTDSPLYTLQRRQHSTASSTSNHSKAAPSSALATKHQYRRSGPPSVFSVLTAHSRRTATHPSTHTSPGRSQSMPTSRHRKRHLHQAIALPLDQQLDIWPSVCSSISVAVPPISPGTLTTIKSSAKNSDHRGKKDRVHFVADSDASEPICRATSDNGDSSTSRSMSRAGSTASVRTHLSEVSMLSIAITVNGLPSMDAMKDQVDKSLAADSEAQLVENAHVSLPHVSFVDTRLIVEPCSAAIETWVN